MTDTALEIGAESPPEEVQKSKGTSTFSRVMRYSLVRLVMLFFTVVVGIYLTVLIANMGGMSIISAEGKSVRRFQWKSI